MLRALGLRSEIFAEAGHIHPGLAGDVRPAERLDAVARPGDVAMLHYSIASPAFARVLDRCGRCAIHYHNITPAELLWRVAPGIALECARAGGAWASWPGGSRRRRRLALQRRRAASSSGSPSPGCSA